jgi:hypothetical protein
MPAYHMLGLPESSGYPPATNSHASRSPSKNGSDDLQATHTAEVTPYVAELHIHLRQHFRQALHDTARLGHQMPLCPPQVARHPDPVGGLKVIIQQNQRRAATAAINTLACISPLRPADSWRAGHSPDTLPHSCWVSRRSPLGLPNPSQSNRCILAPSHGEADGMSDMRASSTSRLAPLSAGDAGPTVRIISCDGSSCIVPMPAGPGSFPCRLAL